MTLNNQVKLKNKSSFKKIESAPKWQISLIIPYLLFSLIFIILPMILIFIYAFKPIQGQAKFENWEIIGKSQTWKIMFRSIWTGLVAAFISFLIGFPYAYILSKSKTLIKILGLSLILSPMAIFTISKALAVRGLFSAIFDENGLNNYAFMIFGMVYLYLPFMVMPLYQILKDMPKNIIEASQDLGYSKFKTWFKTYFVYMLGSIGFTFVITMALSFDDFVITRIVSNTETLGTQLYEGQFQAWSLAIGAISLILVILGNSIYITYKSIENIKMKKTIAQQKNNIIKS